MTTIELDRPTRKILIRARNRIEKYGWIQESFGDKRRGFCLVGAINDAQVFTTRNELWRIRNNAAYALYRCLFDDPGHPWINNAKLYKWNDAEGRTQEEVIDLINRTLENRCEDVPSAAAAT